MTQRQAGAKIPAEVLTAVGLLLARRDRLGKPDTDSEFSHQAGIDEALACLWQAVVTERDGAAQ
jgi:hypothetical protein